MLSIIILTAIITVALTQLRITTLSIIRSLTLAYAFVSVIFLVLQFSNWNGLVNVSLFNGAIVNDILTNYSSFLLEILLVIVLCYYSNSIVKNPPYTLTIVTVILSIGGYYLIVSNDLITFVIALEVQSFSLYALTSIYRWREGATSAGLMYFMLGAFSSGLSFLGLGIIYSYTNETSIEALTSILSISSSNFNLGTIGIIILVSGILFKITAAPFHQWGPEVYDRVPTIITIVLTVIPKIGLISILIRISSISLSLNDILLMISVVSWFFGGTIGLVQSRVKRLLAYSTVSHVGWILGSISVGTILGYGATLFYLFQYSVTTGLTFLTLITVSLNKIVTKENNNNNDIEIITTLNGLNSRSFVITTIFAVTLFSAAGIPPLIGFYAKLSVIQSLIYANNTLVVFLGIIFSVVSAGYYLSLIATILFKQPTRN